MDTSTDTVLSSNCGEIGGSVLVSITTSFPPETDARHHCPQAAVAGGNDVMMDTSADPPISPQFLLDGVAMDSTDFPTSRANTSPTPSSTVPWTSWPAACMSPLPLSSNAHFHPSSHSREGAPTYSSCPAAPSRAASSFSDCFLLFAKTGAPCRRTGAGCTWSHGAHRWMYLALDVPGVTGYPKPWRWMYLESRNTPQLFHRNSPLFISRGTFLLQRIVGVCTQHDDRACA